MSVSVSNPAAFGSHQLVATRKRAACSWTAASINSPSALFAWNVAIWFHVGKSHVADIGSPYNFFAIGIWKPLTKRWLKKGVVVGIMLHASQATWLWS
jgi:hypothetical protein